MSLPQQAPHEAPRADFRSIATNTRKKTNSQKKIYLRRTHHWCNNNSRLSNPFKSGSTATAARRRRPRRQGAPPATTGGATRGVSLSARGRGGADLVNSRPAASTRPTHRRPGIRTAAAAPRGAGNSYLGGGVWVRGGGSSSMWVCQRFWMRAWQ